MKKTGMKLNLTALGGKKHILYRMKVNNFVTSKKKDEVKGDKNEK